MRGSPCAQFPVYTDSQLLARRPLVATEQWLEMFITNIAGGRNCGTGPLRALVWEGSQNCGTGPLRVLFFLRGSPRIAL